MTAKSYINGLIAAFLQKSTVKNISHKKLFMFLLRLKKFLYPSKKSNFIILKIRLFNIIKSLKSLLKSEITCKNKVKLIVNDFLKDLQNLQAILDKDIDKALKTDPAAFSREQIIICYSGFFAVFAYRIAHIIYLKGAKLTALTISGIAKTITGADIHPAATIGEGFFIDHATGVVIGETAVIGKNVVIYHGVTLGSKLKLDEALQKSHRHPKIKDDVTIFADSMILGGDTVIESGKIIPARSLITKSVTD